MIHNFLSSYYSFKVVPLYRRCTLSCLWDAIHYKVRQDGQIKSKAAYIVLGIDLEGMKDILGSWIGENESAKFWLSVLNDMSNRGYEDILIACVDNLSSFSQAIEAIYPKT